MLIVAAQRGGEMLKIQPEARFQHNAEINIELKLLRIMASMEIVLNKYLYNVEKKGINAEV